MVRRVVETNYGRLAGQERDGITSFLGIPFAAPPFGAYRFRAPRPPERWHGTRAAEHKGAIAPQPTGGPIALDAGEPGEDCLNLNIWTPDPTRAGGLPVMVFAHGGGQVMGTGSDPLYDGEILAREGVVVVTTNRRLGAEGFLYLGELFPDERGTGNFGLLDQIESLRWVKENIRGFGGNPDNVTLFGESGGGAATTAVLSMPRSRGLIQRAIAQSAGANTLDPQRAARHTREILSLVGVEPGDWDALTAVPWQRFVEVFPRAMALSDDGVPPYVPTVGGLMPESPTDAIPAGAARDIPLLIGSNRDEETLFDMLIPEGAPDPRLAQARAALERNGVQLDAVLAAYADARPDLSTEAREQALLGDLRFRIPSLRIAEGHARHSPGQTFVYLFTWESQRLGAAHALELLPLFGHWDVGMSKLFGAVASPELERTLRTAWTAFARTGDPSTDALPWPSYGAPGRPTMELCEQPRVLDDPFARERGVLGGLAG